MNQSNNVEFLKHQNELLFHSESVPQNEDNEPAEILFAKIRSKQENKLKPKKRSKAKSAKGSL